MKIELTPYQTALLERNFDRAMQDEVLTADNRTQKTVEVILHELNRILLNGETK